MIGGSRGSKSRLTKAAGAEPSGGPRDPKVLEAKMLKHFILGSVLEVELLKMCTRLWCEAHVEKHRSSGTLLEGTVRCSVAGAIILRLVRSEPTAWVLQHFQKKRWRAWDV